MIILFYFILLILSLFGLSWIPDSVATFLVLCLIDFLIGKAIWQDYKPFEPYKEPIEEFLSEQWDKWNSHSGLKKTYFVLGFIASVILLILLVFIAIKFVETIDAKKTRFRDVALALFATLSGFGVLFGFYTSIVRTETAEQGQITERLNKAIENLGKSNKDGDPVIEVRIGALLALERIAQDSIRDHIQIMEIICAYVRHNSPLLDETESTGEITQIKTKRKKNKDDIIDEDIQTAITIIGRRDKWPEGKKRLKKEYDHKYEIDLFECNLCGAKFSRANLNGALLIGSDMREAWFDDADLSNAALGNADLTDAWFERATLKNTKWHGAITDKIHARIGDFLECKALTQKQINVMFFGKGVEMPKNRKHPQKGTDYYKDYATFDNFMDARKEWLVKIYPDIIKKKKTKK